jgi:phosphoribosylformylglycinamidine synthase
MAEACRALDFPVVSGNVSLYNETKNDDGTSLAILPTPAIGGVGLLEDWEKSATIGFKNEGDEIYIVGDRSGHLGQSLWLDIVHQIRDGAPPRVDLGTERRTAEMVRRWIGDGRVTAVHDVSDGGPLVAIAEMALAGGIGARLDGNVSGHADRAFSEDQGVYIVTVRPGSALDSDLAAPAGVVGGQSLKLVSGDEIALADLRAAHESFFPRLMGGELPPEG